jgi:phenylpropionate dioxygenase-like ring-hydroxylating dioxygenase large terminal subunit
VENVTIVEGQGLDSHLSDGTALSDIADTDPRHPRIGRRIYVDPEIFEFECDRIFRRAWCFLGHETEIPERGDYVARELAREPVVLIRGEDGVVRAFLNSCRHRGMRVCRADRDHVRYLRCPYHGWTYDSNGELVRAFAEELYEPGRLPKSELGLIPVTQLDSYRGLYFATWDEDAPPLREFLGDIAWYLDTLLDRTEEGTEVVGTAQVWQVETNWKFCVDNFSGDPYHLSTAHGSVAQLGLLPSDPMSGHEGHAINAGRGHQLLLKPSIGEESQYYGLPQHIRDQMARDPDETRRELIKNTWFNVGTVFPNFSYLQIEIQGDPGTPATPFLNFRLWQPISATRTAVWSWLFMDKGVSAEFHKRSYDTYVRTFGPSGIYEQDDAEIWEECTRVNGGKVAQQYSLHHGMGLHVPPDTAFPGRGTAYEGTFTEVTQLAWYEEWRRWLTEPTPWMR